MNISTQAKILNHSAWKGSYKSNLKVPSSLSGDFLLLTVWTNNDDNATCEIETI